MPLPRGYELDPEPQSQQRQSAPPSGYQIDQPAQQPAPRQLPAAPAAPQQSWSEYAQQGATNFARGAGREFMSGVAGLAHAAEKYAGAKPGPGLAAIEREANAPVGSGAEWSGRFATDVLPFGWGPRVATFAGLAAKTAPRVAGILERAGVAKQLAGELGSEVADVVRRASVPAGLAAKTAWGGATSFIQSGGDEHATKIGAVLGGVTSVLGNPTMAQMVGHYGSKAVVAAVSGAMFGHPWELVGMFSSLGLGHRVSDVLQVIMRSRAAPGVAGTIATEMTAPRSGQSGQTQPQAQQARPAP